MATPREDAQPKQPNLHEIFDLSRQKLTASLVNQIEQCLRDVASAQDDLKQICASAREQHFKPKEVTAMKRVAKLRLKGEEGRAREELETLQRIADCVGMDLFSWQEAAN